MNIYFGQPYYYGVKYDVINFLREHIRYLPHYAVMCVIEKKDLRRKA
jgi:hypothetical protein